MKAEDIRKMSVEEIQLKLKDLCKEFLTLRLGKRTGQVDKPTRIVELKRTIARLETILSEKSRGELVK